MVIIDDETEAGRPVSSQLSSSFRALFQVSRCCMTHPPLRAASKNGEAKTNTSLCALCSCIRFQLDAGTRRENNIPKRGRSDGNLYRSRKARIFMESRISIDKFIGLVILGGQAFILAVIRGGAVGYDRRRC